MPNIRANLIISVKDESSANLQKVGAAGKGASDDLQKGFAGAVKELTGFDLASISAAGAIVGVAAALKGAIDETIRWGDEVDALSRVTGQSAEDTSRLAIVMGDIGISSGTLTQASKALRSQGLVPTLDTIKDLARQYQAIEDPVERNKWGAKTLGRAYNDLSEALSRTPEELDALAKAADLSGRVMDEKAVAAAEKYAQSLAQLDDKVKGLQVSVGNVLIPTLTTAGTAFGQLTQIGALLNVKFQAATGIISENEAAQRAAAIAAGDLTAVYQEQIDSALDPAIDATLRNIDAQAQQAEAAAATADALSFQNLTLGYGTSAYTTHTKAVQDAKAAEEEAAAAADTAARVYGLAADALNAANIPLNEKIALEKELALLSGATTKELEREKDAVAFLTTQLSLGNLEKSEYVSITSALATGEMTAQEAMDAVTKSVKDQTSAMEGAEPVASDLMGSMDGVGTAANNSARDVADLRSELDMLHDKTVTITTNHVSVGGGGGASGGGGRAHGGQVSPNTAYSVGEQGPEMFVPQTHGYIFPAQVTGTANGMSNSSMSALVAQIVMAINAIPRAVRDGLQKAY